MFLKYLEISKHTEQSSWKKLWKSYFGWSCRLSNCNFFKNWIIYTGCFQDSTFFKNRLILRNTSEWLLSPNLHMVYLYACSTFHYVIIISFLKTSSKFTEHFQGLNKVHYSVSGRKDFTALLTSVVGQQIFINIKWIKIYFNTGKNLQKSLGWFKFLKGNIILCKVSVLYKLHMINDNLIRAFCLSDIGQSQGANNKPLLLSNIREERYYGHEVGFITSY